MDHDIQKPRQRWRTSNRVSESDENWATQTDNTHSELEFLYRAGMQSPMSGFMWSNTAIGRLDVSAGFVD